MKVIAIYNLKGGVGKTAATVNLSYLASRGGYRTLVWDLDAQGTASFYFRNQPRPGRDPSYLLDKSKGLGKALRATNYDGLDLTQADLSYRNLDLELDDYKKSKLRLRRQLGRLKNKYDIAVSRLCTEHADCCREHIQHGWRLIGTAYPDSTIVARLHGFAGGAARPFGFAEDELTR